MGPVPDHIPSTAAAEHAALIVALDAGDLDGPEQDRATSLAVACPGCGSLLADLAVLRAATAELPAAPRFRDYSLTDADAARLRPSRWAGLIGWLAGPSSNTRPLAGALAVLGIAGLLLNTAPGLFGGTATSLSTVGAPITAPVEAGSASAAAAAGDAGLGAASGVAQSVTPTTLTAPAGAAGVQSPPSAAPDARATFGAAVLPAPSAAAAIAPSPFAITNPAPTTIPTAGVLAGPPTAATAGPAAASSVANDSVPKAASPVTPVERTVALLVSLSLLVAGLGLFAASRALRRRASV